MTNRPQRPPNPVTVAFLALDGVQGLDVLGPMEAFAVAGRYGAAYDLRLASAAGTPIRTHAGPELGPAVALADLPSSLDTLVLCGGSEATMRQAWQDGAVVGAIRDRAPRVRRLVSICSGAFLLAATGLLDGRRAATHWQSAPVFRQLFPDVQLDADAIFVVDPPYYTSAGVTAGIDLTLALIEADYGSRVALAVARELVLFLRRPGGQAQFSAGMALSASGPKPLAALAARILDDPSGRRSGEGRTTADLAAAVAMGERTFLRAFRKATGTTPGRFVEEARLARAKLLLEQTADPLDRIAFDAGYGSVDGLTRAFRRAMGLTPGAYRARFGPVRPDDDARTSPD
jgi:transcriptional regulator GlxA family with amidase domain